MITRASSLQRFRLLLPATTLAFTFMSCDWGRVVWVQDPTYQRDVAAILERRCAECHTGDDAEAGWRADSYLDAIGCVETTGEPAILPANEMAPLLRSLEDENHEDILSDRELQTLNAWVHAGAPFFHGSLHDPGFNNPREPQFHGQILRDQRWRQMLSADSEDSCGSCHAGAPVVSDTLRHPPSNVPSCQSCHLGPDGALSCNTCHGHDDRGHPPSDPCFASENDPEAGAHAVHLDGGELNAPTLNCSDCHPNRDTNVGQGAHGDGIADIELNPDVAGEDASYDVETGTCSVVCHNQGGERPEPAWTDEGPLECGDCHLAPPENHNPASCDTCHVEANADGTELTPGPLHLNGQADLSDGSNRCGSCHGTGDDPWPESDRHPNHMNPELSHAIDCETCHIVPDEVGDDGHINDETEGAEVTFSGLAGADAVYDTETQNCTVACHDQGGARAQPAWNDEGPLECGDCHQSPPEGHHPATCDTCHSGVSPSGDELFSINLHLNGEVELGDGSGDCGACHGTGDDPSPQTGIHRSHLQPTLSTAVPCETCHIVPEEVDDEGHLDETEHAEVTLNGLAAARDVTPSYLALTCTDVACHGAGLPSVPSPMVRWDDVSGAATRCGTCHGVPPPPPHTSSTTCESLLCHGGEVAQWPDGPRISDAGRALHMNGVIEAGGRP